MMSINFFMFLLLLLSSIIVLSSPSWFCMWIGIEINTMAFIPLMYNPKNKLPTESSLKYFLVQTFASMIMMIAIIAIMQKEFFSSMYLISAMMSMSMGIKLGAAPFHMWYPPVIEGLQWLQNMILMTWQKIAPLFIMWMSSMSWMLLVVTIMSLMIGSFGAFNQSSLRKLMAYSSITHMSWILAPMIISSTLWSIYMLIYFMTTVIMILSFYVTKVYYMYQMNLISMPLTSMILINLLSMGGFPPFLGFVGKWLVLNNLVMNSMFFLSFMMIMSSWMNLYIYLRVIQPSFHIYIYLMKTSFSEISMINMLILSLISSFSSLIIIMIA